MDQFSFFNNVTAISPRLHEEQFYLQIVDNLDTLMQCWNKLFRNVLDRVSRQNQRLNDMQRRIAAVHAQLNALRQLASKAVVIQSSLHFPAFLESTVQSLRDELSLYARDMQLLHSQNQAQSSEVMAQFIHYAEATFDMQNMRETHLLNRQTGHNASSLLPRLRQKSYNLYDAVVPEHDTLITGDMCGSSIQSVSSLLVFNTSRNLLYRAPTSSKSSSRWRRQPPPTAAHSIIEGRVVAAGVSTTVGRRRRMQASLFSEPAATAFLRRDFAFSAGGNILPSMMTSNDILPPIVQRISSAPAVDFPETLFGLSNIADDFVLDDDDTSFFRRSMSAAEPVATTVTPSRAADLYNDSAQFDRTTENVTSTKSTRRAAASESVNNMRNTATPHPATPPPSTVPAGNISLNSSPMSAPPPPPPPPMPSLLPELLVNTPPKTKPAAADDGNNNDRSSLMAAIRGAGGFGKARLRRVKSKDDDGKSVNNQRKNHNNNDTVVALKGAASQLDLLGELKKHLNSRRPAIAGNASRTQSSSITNNATSSSFGNLPNISEKISSNRNSNGNAAARPRHRFNNNAAATDNDDESDDDADWID